MKWYVVALLVVTAYLAAIPVLKKLGFGFKYGVLYAYTRRTEFVDGLTRGWTGRVLKIVVKLSPVVAIAGIGLAAYSLIHGAASKHPGATPLVPGVTLPLISGAIAVGLTVAVHELGHAVAARFHGIGVRRIGVFLAVVIPGAFVEPDPESFERAPLKAKLEVLSSGPAFNVVTALLTAALVDAAMFSQPYVSPGVLVLKPIIKGVPLHRGDIITSVAGHPVRDIHDLKTVVNSLKPGSVVPVKTQRGTVWVKIHERGGTKLIGILVTNRYYNLTITYIVEDILSFLQLLGIISLGIGIANLLPIVPLDGGRILKEMLERVIEPKTAKNVTHAISIVFIVLLISNLGVWAHG